MKKNGFTLIELLAVIVLIAVVATIAITSSGAISSAVKRSMLDKKISLIEEAAILKAEDMRGAIKSSNTKYKGYPCISIMTSDLVPVYLDKDVDDECLSATANRGGCITNPTSDGNYLDRTDIILYYNNKRVYAKMDYDNTDGVSNCFVYGDLNDDQIVNSEDALLLSQHYCKSINLGAKIKKADVNLDGEIDKYDRELIIRYTMNLVESLPTTENVTNPSEIVCREIIGGGGIIIKG